MTVATSQDLATIIWDLDGTLCTTPPGTDLASVEDLLARCTPRPELVRVARQLLRRGHPTRILTARSISVAAATRAQVRAWFEADAERIHVDHSPRLQFEFKFWIQDKVDSIRRAPGQVKIKVGDRSQDRIAAESAGALFVWDHAVKIRGIQALPGVAP